MNTMTAALPSAIQPLGSFPGMTPTMPPPAPYFPRKFWIVSEGKTIAADEADVQALVDGGQVDLDIMSQDPGSAWTKPAALGFVARSVPPVSEPAPIAPVQPPAPPTDWPTRTPVPEEASTRADTSTPAQRERLASAPTTPLSSPGVSKQPVKPAQPLVLLDFAMELVTGIPTGTKFRLANGEKMDSPIPEVGVSITAGIVRQGLAQVEKEYKSRGQAPDSKKVAEIQEAVVLLAAFLNFRAKLSGEPVARHLIQFAAAVADFQHTLHVVINSKD